MCPKVITKTVEFEIPEGLDARFRDDYSIKKGRGQVVFEEENFDWITVSVLDEETRRYKTISIKKEWVCG